MLSFCFDYLYLVQLKEQNICAIVIHLTPSLPYHYYIRYQQISDGSIDSEACISGFGKSTHVIIFTLGHETTRE